VFAAGRRLLALGAAAVAAGAAQAGSLTGPIVDVGLRVEIEDVLQLPATAASPPLARVNLLREVPDGSGRLFVNDLRGPLYVLDGATLQTYLDLSVELPLKTAPNIGTGFASFAFHPDFASNGLFYTVHTENVGAVPPNHEPALPALIDQHSIVTEWEAVDPAANLFAGTRRELIRVAAISTNHNIGEIAFDPTLPPTDPDYGLLHLGAGDYGSVALGQPAQLQRLDTLYGALLRIDPLGGPFLRDGTLYDYGIPPTNPLVGVAGTLGEIYAFGFRNAHRLAWDADGTLLVSDIGQGNVEEVNVVAGGGNHGWPEREGTFAIDVETDPEVVFALPPSDPVPYGYPVAQYDHDEGVAIAGGFVYRGAAIPELVGRFVFGDIRSGRLLYADMDALLAADDGDPATTAPVYELGLLQGGVATTLLAVVQSEAPGVQRADLRFGVDAASELYVTTKQDGFVRRLARDSRPDCDDGFDDDDDGLVDLADPGCRDSAWATESPQCNDGVDNDLDGGVDFDGSPPDTHCTQPWRNREAPRLCGLGFEVAPLLVLLHVALARRRAFGRRDGGHLRAA
jgi:hypothetical protein